MILTMNPRKASPSRASAARREVLDHGTGEAGWLEFLAEVGDREDYDAQQVLAWLGY
jgi:hypothetical protein